MKEWFVLNTLTGRELKLIQGKKKSGSNDREPGLIESLAASHDPDLTPFIGQMIVPQLRETKVDATGKKRSLMKRLFPGYIFIELELYFDARRKQLNKELWDFINGVDGVIGFLGAERNTRGEMIRPPSPMTDEEIRNIKAHADPEHREVKQLVSFEPGETVRIVEGSFIGSQAVIDSIDPEKGMVVLNVTIFGQQTRLEANYSQIERFEATEDEQQAGM